MNNEFVQGLLGNQSPAHFLLLVFYALLAALVSLLLQTTDRDVTSPESPVHFSWKFLWQDNVKRIITTLILIYLGLRFTPQLFGIEVNEFVALSLGLGFDKLSQVVKNKTNIFAQKKPAKAATA